MDGSTVGVRCIASRPYLKKNNIMIHELNSCTQPYFSIDYVYALHKRLDGAEKDRDEFAIGFLKFASQDKQIQRLIDCDDITDELLLSEYKATLNKREPVIGIGIPEGGKDYEGEIPRPGFI